MKTKKNTSIIYTLTLFASLSTGLAFGQEENAKLPKKLDFLVTTAKSDSIAPDGSTLFDLYLDIKSNEISEQERVYVKVISKNPREIYFIRAIDKEVLSGRKDIKVWEKELAKKEKEREKERKITNKKKSKKTEKIKPKYEKQKGREINKVEQSINNTKLVLGPFSPGDYLVYVQLMEKYTSIVIISPLVQKSR